LKYEETLIKDYKHLYKKKQLLAIRIDYAAYTLIKVKLLDTKLQGTKYIYFKMLFMCKKIRQIGRVERRSKIRFKKLAQEFWPLEKKVNDIRDTLSEYYDKQIEESVLGMGIENVSSLEELVILKNDKFKEQHE